MLKDKVCIITGGASGIGLAMADLFAKEGSKVVVADINEENLIKEANKLGVSYFKADLSKREDCKALVDFTLNKYKKVNILINVAGMQNMSTIEDFPEDKWDFMISLMLTAPFLLTKYVWPSMREQGWGRVINLNSIHGLVASEFKPAYVAAKHGLTGFTKSAALEGGPYGITVNSICPSYVNTPLVARQVLDQAKAHGISEEEVLEKIMLEKSAIKKLIKAESIAEVAKFLCSDAGNHITGSNMTIDGGWTAG